SSRSRHPRFSRDWSSDVCSSDLGGEQRISNFIIWQLAYTELYFTNRYWPDFNAASLDDAFAWYRERERRFGRTSAQLVQAGLSKIGRASCRERGGVWGARGPVAT